MVLSDIQELQRIAIALKTEYELQAKKHHERLMALQERLDALEAKVSLTKDEMENL